ncbi:MAG: hypothetical protein ACYDH9_12370 [Limisphaerales bacterium]
MEKTNVSSEEKFTKIEIKPKCSVTVYRTPTRADLRPHPGAHAQNVRHVHDRGGAGTYGQ